MANRTQLLFVRTTVAGRHYDLAAVVCLIISLICCSRAKSAAPAETVHGRVGEWKLVATKDARGSTARLRYRDREVRLNAEIVTPLGTFVPVARRHTGSAAGWGKTSDDSSESIPTRSGVALTPLEVSGGFHETSESEQRPSDTDGWVYVRGARFHGWVRPDKLFDQNFLNANSLRDTSTIWKE